jgi:hypothetical protein
MYIHIHVYMCTYICIHIHAHTRTHTHTHTHTHIFEARPRSMCALIDSFFFFFALDGLIQLVLSLTMSKISGLVLSNPPNEICLRRVYVCAYAYAYVCECECECE